MSKPPRHHIIRDLETAMGKTDDALRFLRDPEVDVWRAVADIQAAEEFLAVARELLVSVSREALQKALDGES